MDTERLRLTIEENAIDSLDYAVWHWIDKPRPTSLKHAVLQTFQAISLFLKLRLSSLDTNAIWEDSSKTGPTARTVGFDECVRRLKLQGVCFSSAEKKALRRLRSTRNMIEHLEFNLAKEQVEKYIRDAFRFLDEFFETELGGQFSDHLDANRHQKILELIYTYKERVARAKREAERFRAIFHILAPPTD